MDPPDVGFPALKLSGSLVTLPFRSLPTCSKYVSGQKVLYRNAGLAASELSGCIVLHHRSTWGLRHQGWPQHLGDQEDETSLGWKPYSNRFLSWCPLRGAKLQECWSLKHETGWG